MELKDIREAKVRSLEEIFDKITEYEKNIEFLDKSILPAESMKEELERELVVLKWCVGLVEEI